MRFRSRFSFIDVIVCRDIFETSACSLSIGYILLISKLSYSLGEQSHLCILVCNRYRNDRTNYCRKPFSFVRDRARPHARMVYDILSAGHTPKPYIFTIIRPARLICRKHVSNAKCPKDDTTNRDVFELENRNPLSHRIQNVR